MKKIIIKKVEEYLVSIITNWDSYFVKNSDFVCERVRRSIPPLSELEVLVESCYDTIANIECIKTGNRLFDKGPDKSRICV